MSEHSHSHSHSPHSSLPGSVPLRSAMKHRDSRPSRPSSPTPITLPFIPISPHNSPGPLASAGYTHKVSFDTFENPAASMFSYTLSVKSEGYSRNKSTRVFLCAASRDSSGSQALDWALESLVQDSDELVVFRGVDPEDLDKDHNIAREEARDLLHLIEAKSIEYDPDRKVSIIVEYIAGKVTDTIDRLIALYRPDSVVVGTRGQRSMIQSWGAAFGAPVRPERKVKKAMEKRKADPKRGKHFDELTKMKSLPIGSIPL